MSPWRRSAFLAMMSTKRWSDSGGISLAPPCSVSAAERTAVTGVRSSWETLATKSRRMVSSRLTAVTSRQTTSIDDVARESSVGSKPARARRTRGLMPEISISREAAPVRA